MPGRHSQVVLVNQDKESIQRQKTDSAPCRQTSAVKPSTTCTPTGYEQGRDTGAPHEPPHFNLAARGKEAPVHTPSHGATSYTAPGSQEQDSPPTCWAFPIYPCCRHG